MSSTSASTTKQRQELETVSFECLKKYIPPIKGALSVKQKTLQANFQSALKGFYDRLPYNQGAPLCIEDLLSYSRSLSKTSAWETVMTRLTEYLIKPPFVSYLAAFGRLPNYPYILVFDPHGYQHLAPPDAPAPLAKDKSDDLSNILMPTKAELEQQEKELVDIFKESLQNTSIICRGCKESKFMRYHEIQRRSADEGSSYLYHCANCNTTGMSR